MNATSLSRDELARMLGELSDEALRYVCRPIAYAYYLTDYHDPDRLTDDDCLRLDLICAAANGSEDYVVHLGRWAHALDCLEREDKLRKAGQA